jgi:hypothetical protein
VPAFQTRGVPIIIGSFVRFFPPTPPTPLSHLQLLPSGSSHMQTTLTHCNCKYSRAPQQY